MNAHEKMVKHMMAVMYEHLLEVGEETFLKEVACLPKDELSVYPHVKERLYQQEETGLSKNSRAELGWIKAAPETMPPDGQEVIATTKWKTEKYVEFGLYRKDGKWLRDYNNMDGGDTEYYSDDEVTHWRPYPEPAED